MAMILQPMPEPVVVIEPQPAIIQPVMQQQVIYQEPAVIQSAPPITVVQAGPAVVVQPNLGESPGRMKCMYCQQEIVTVTKPVTGILTWTIFGVLLACLIWPFCLIPFCCAPCKDVEHTCPYCHNILSVYKRM
ncbi:hypothetical protein AMEX_G24473 [Astyanax mexicanus]|uniref:LITAF domain-containing protein n=1 Tax=Astyanax mexicanus TaxID=7994 RepID=A0A8T2L049_ASTMX|nr:hypothetical protein AMEX_G24473 [Astyanax mexicanus]